MVILELKILKIKMTHNKPAENQENKHDRYMKYMICHDMIICYMIRYDMI